jgi:hypothetical protein
MIYLGGSCCRELHICTGETMNVSLATENKRTQILNISACYALHKSTELLIFIPLLVTDRYYSTTKFHKMYAYIFIYQFIIL